jgi:hypothetical protein
MEGVIIVKLPSQQKIASRLYKIGIGDFVKQTQIDEKLSKKKLTPFQVYMAVEHASYKYQQCLLKPSIAMLDKRAEIITAILKDHPTAINELKELGILE